MSLPTQENFPKPNSQEGLIAWAARVYEFVQRNMATFALYSYTKTLSNGANNNVDFSNGMMVQITGPSGAFNITGIGGGSSGRIIVLINTTGQTMTLIEESASSSANNRIDTFGGGDVDCDGALLAWSDNLSRWCLIGSYSAAGGSVTGTKDIAYWKWLNGSTFGTSIGHIVNANPATGVTIGGVINTNDTQLDVGRIIITRTCTLATLEINVTGNGLNVSVRFGVWDTTSDDDHFPNALLYDSGNVAANTLGVKTCSPALALTPGQYWVGLTSNSGTGGRGVTQVTAIGAANQTLIGLSSTFTRQTMFRKTITSMTLTDPFGTGSVSILNSDMPMIRYTLDT